MADYSHSTGEKTSLGEYLLRPIVFERLHRATVAQAWRGHVPFAFWCIDVLRPALFVELGAYLGDSYCSFCQAIDSLSLTTQCYAVDTWRGDVHTGSYGEGIFEALRAYHDPRYGRFSRLIRSPFDEAAREFGDGSVDLLHHDGTHTYDALVHDFRVWLPKMSQRGVILLHDINVRLPGYGAWRFWGEVSASYPSFAFPHSFGLGVLAVGVEVPAPIRWLAQCTEREREFVRDLFEALGDRLVCTTERERLSGELKRVLESPSWRITAPLRWVRDQLARGRAPKA